MRTAQLPEYDRQVFDGIVPSPSDLNTAAQLAEDLEKKLDIRWLSGERMEVTSTSWVGVVDLECCRIEVRPKFAGDSLGVVKMLMYAMGFGSIRRLMSNRSFDSGPDLVDLICVLLAGEVQSIIRNGVIRDYLSTEDSLPHLRGSLRYRDQATRRFGQLDVLECRFDEFDGDVADNQLLRAGLRQGARLCSDSSTRRLLHRLDRSLADVASLPSDPVQLASSERTYSRRNERYRAGHELCSLLLRVEGISDLFDAGKTRSFTFLLDMNQVFESFVSKAIDDAFAGDSWRVDSQVRFRSVIRNRETNRTYASIIPDIVMTDGQTAVPFDAKYKLYGSGRKVSTSDIFQSFVYAYALSEADMARAGIVYPSHVRQSRHPALTVESRSGAGSAHVTGVGIDLVSLVNALDDPETWDAALGLLRRDIISVLEG